MQWVTRGRGVEIHPARRVGIHIQKCASVSFIFVILHSEGLADMPQNNNHDGSHSDGGQPREMKRHEAILVLGGGSYGDE